MECKGLSQNTYFCGNPLSHIYATAISSNRFAGMRGDCLRQKFLLADSLREQNGVWQNRACVTDMLCRETMSIQGTRRKG